MFQTLLLSSEYVRADAPDSGGPGADPTPSSTTTVTDTKYFQTYFPIHVLLFQP